MFDRIRNLDKLLLIDPVSNSKGAYFHRKLTVLEWLMRWKVSTPRLLQELLNSSQSSFSRTLKTITDEKLVRVINTHHILHRKLIIPTAKGEKLIKAYMPEKEFIVRRVTPAMINVDRVVHDLFCQHIAVRFVYQDWEIITEPEARAMTTTRLRRADILAFNRGENETYVAEVELSRKNGDARIKMLSSLAQDLNDGKLDFIFFFCHPRIKSVGSAIQRELENQQLPKFKRHNDTGKLMRDGNKWASLNELKESYIFKEFNDLNDIYFPEWECK